MMALFVVFISTNRNLFSSPEETITRSKYGTINCIGVYLHFLGILITSGQFNSTMSTPGLLVPVTIKLSGYGIGSLVLVYLF
ncbi:hypothetical protein L6452_39359 [Arctium lappa]|uniref:Uncharacterized protein n=1 Tax=Arctium lappa TaxID=4217 RepID=A0ACB8XSI8_ARCLA|nr:hypothetical protein L6452_39359 [Arctium lappa]